MNREIKYKGHEFACHINKNGEVVYWCWNCKGYYPKNKMSTETICQRCFKPTIDFHKYNLEDFRKKTDERSKVIVEVTEEIINSIYEERKKWAEGYATLYRDKKGNLKYVLIEKLEKFVKKKVKENE